MSGHKISLKTCILLSTLMNMLINVDVGNYFLLTVI